MRRIAITGSSGYYGSRLVRYIRETDPRIEILGIDLAPPRGQAPHEFAALDVRDPSLWSSLADFRADTVVHLAFVLNPIHDDSRMHDVNINGLSNVLSAVHKTRPQRLLVASSATAYGAWPDNPVPIEETWPIRGRPEFRYACDKATLEGMIASFAAMHPEMCVSWTRPAIIYGPAVDNFLSRMLLHHPAVVLPDGCDVPQQFVHEDDLVAATWCILKNNGRGPYNVGPPDWIHLTDIARETGRFAVRFPLWVMNLAAKICWTLRIPILPYPPGMNLYVRYPWIVAPTRLCRELGFRFQYGSLDTLRELFRAQEQTTSVQHPGSQQRTPISERRRAG